MAVVFESLHGQAKRNVEAMTRTESGRTRTRSNFMDQGGCAFTVFFYDRSPQFGTACWSHWPKGAIEVESFGFTEVCQPALTATVTLHTHGECRLLVDCAALHNGNS